MRGAAALGAAVLGAALALAACAAPAALPPADPRVVLLPDVPLLVRDGPAVSVDPTGMTRVSLELFNPTDRDVVVESTTDWFDKNQHSVRGVLSEPRRMVVPRLETASLEATSPGPKAVRFRIQIAPNQWRSA